MIDFGFPPLRSPSVMAVITNAAWLAEASNSGAIATAAKCLVRVFNFILLLPKGVISFSETLKGDFAKYSFYSYG
jgi:hypothetical protein